MADRKRPYHHPDLRSALLDAARDVVERDGHEKLSLRGLATRLDVSATAPQAHFANKRALLWALARLGFDALREKLEECALSGDAVDDFTALGGAYLAFASERRGLFKLMFGAEIDLDDDEDLAAAGVAAFNVLRSAVAAHGPAQAAPEEVEIKALIAWATVHGLAHITIDPNVSSRLDIDLSAVRLERAAAEFVARNLKPDS